MVCSMVLSVRLDWYHVPLKSILQRHFEVPVFVGKDTTTAILGEQWSYTTLLAAGLAVGLPEGRPGNSETGHLTIGAGRTILQDELRIARAVARGELSENPALMWGFKKASAHGGKVHIIMMLSEKSSHGNIKEGVGQSWRPRVHTGLRRFSFTWSWTAGAARPRERRTCCRCSKGKPLIEQTGMLRPPSAGGWSSTGAEATQRRPAWLTWLSRTGGARSSDGAGG